MVKISVVVLGVAVIVATGTAGCILSDMFEKWTKPGCRLGRSFSHVSLYMDNKTVCGGTYVGGGQILTAASCIVDCSEAANLFKVEIHFDSPEGKTERLPVKGIKFHPDYCSKNSTKSAPGANLALIGLERNAASMLSPAMLSNEDALFTELQISNGHNINDDRDDPGYDRSFPRFNIKRVPVERQSNCFVCSDGNNEDDDYFCGTNNRCTCGPMLTDLGSGSFDSRGFLNGVLVEHRGDANCYKTVEHVYAQVYTPTTASWIKKTVVAGNVP